jgi:hypothetical protein
MRWLAVHMALFGVFLLMAIVGLLVWTSSPGGRREAGGPLLFCIGVGGMAALVLFTVLEHSRGSRPPPSRRPPGGDFQEP